MLDGRIVMLRCSGVKAGLGSQSWAPPPRPSPVPVAICISSASPANPPSFGVQRGVNCELKFRRGATLPAASERGLSTWAKKRVALGTAWCKLRAHLFGAGGDFDQPLTLQGRDC